MQLTQAYLCAQIRLTFNTPLLQHVYKLTKKSSNVLKAYYTFYNYTFYNNKYYYWKVEVLYIQICPSLP